LKRLLKPLRMMRIKTTIPSKEIDIIRRAA
jgi:hypothetical protein